MTALIGLMAVVISASVSGQVEDECDAKEVIDQLVISWNDKDAEAYSSFFSLEADYVTSSGTRFAGREQIKQRLTKSFSEPQYGDSRHVPMKTTVRFILPDVAIVDAEWELSGVRDEDGNELTPRQGIAVIILRKTDEEWLIEAIRSMVPTNIE
jgi:uncharacterized protein (TIGR02246 family)